MSALAVAGTGSPRLTRPALRYYGGKWKIAPWVIEQFPPPESYVCYVEPFGGAMSVLLRKPPARHEVYNDLDSEVVNFFRVLRERPQELITLLRLTPFSREEFDLAYDKDCADPLERARRLYIRSQQSMHGGARAQWRTGWRHERSPGQHQRTVDRWRGLDHLWAVIDRIREIQIEHDAAMKVIARFDAPGTLFYVDPPYLPDTRSDRWRATAYQHELTEEDHRALAAQLHAIKGMAVVSGYPSPLYTELYDGWKCVQRETRTDANAIRTECLWISPRAAASRASRQLTLIDDEHHPKEATTNG